MKIYLRHVLPLGFKGSGMWDDSKWYQFYYKIVPSKRRVYIIDALECTLSYFRLTIKQYKAYMSGELSLVPLGCCCASGGRYIENPVLAIRAIRNKKNDSNKLFLKMVKRYIGAK
jgi:hypothetical protein